MRARSLLVGCLVVTLAGTAHAQTPFTAGANYVGPYIGLATYGSTASFGGAFEHAINEHVGWGVAADYFSYSESYSDYSGTASGSTTFFSVGATVAYHFDVHNEKLDPFVAGIVGYNVVSGGTKACSYGTCEESGGHASGILIGGFGGARYWIKDNLALVGRVGYGLGYLSVGVDFKL